MCYSRHGFIFVSLYNRSFRKDNPRDDKPTKRQDRIKVAVAEDEPQDNDTPVHHEEHDVPVKPEKNKRGKKSQRERKKMRNVQTYVSFEHIDSL